MVREKGEKIANVYGPVWLVPKISLLIFWQPTIFWYLYTWLVATFLVAYEILPTLLTFSS
jgi:hypothetical protein